MLEREKAIEFFEESHRLIRISSPGSLDLLKHFEVAIRAIRQESECKKCASRTFNDVLGMPEFGRAMDTVDEAYRQIIEDVKKTGGKNIGKFFPSNWKKDDHDTGSK